MFSECINNNYNLDMEIKRFLNYIKGNITFYDTPLILVIRKVRGEKESEKFNQGSKEMVFNYTVNYIILIRIKLRLSEEEFYEMYQERVEAFQKTILQE